MIDFNRQEKPNKVTLQSTVSLSRKPAEPTIEDNPELTREVIEEEIAAMKKFDKAMFISSDEMSFFSNFIFFDKRIFVFFCKINKFYYIFDNEASILSQ